MKGHMSNLSRSSIAVWCVCGAILIAMSRSGLLNAQSVAAPSTHTLLELRNVDDLKTLFNKDAGKFRLVLLLSPTCPVCVVGSQWIQEQILARYPDAKLRVYAIWFNMFPGDARSKWRPDLLTDPRVIHRWDEEKVVGRWYGERKSALRPKLTAESNWNGDILWDAYVLYSPKAGWDDAPNGVIHLGRTIVAARETLRIDAERLFKP
jgi:hypothetical protein